MPVPDRKRRLTAFAVAMAVLIAIPLAVVASDAFTDVPDSNVHHGDITWLKDAGVTVGCNPPANTEFCPGDPVLRQQMASFMRRLAENQVVDAATAIEAEHAATADDADMLDGQDSTAYETRRASESCGLIVVPGPAVETTCLPATGGVTPADTTVELLRVDLSAPVSGTVEANASATSDLIMWYSLNEICAPLGTTGEAIFNQAVNGHLFGLDNDGNGSIEHNRTVAFAAPAGNHALRLCGISTGADGGFAIGSLTAAWSAGGSVDIASSGGSSPLPASLAEQFSGALGG